MSSIRPFVQMLLIAASVFAVGCTTYIIAPQQPSAAVSVFLVDHGRHSSLVLPDAAGGGLTEYTYGDWNWFALGRSRWHNLFATLFLPTRGAMGRRQLEVKPDTADIRLAVDCEQVLNIVVGKSEAKDLSEELHRQFEQHIDSLHFQRLYDLDFVHSDRSFHLLHNCNHMVANWLRQLGCQVRGPAMLADFVLKQQTDS